MVRFDPGQRKAFIAVNDKGEHKINLIMSFPDTYPEEAPVFRFDPSTTIEESSQVNLLTNSLLCITSYVLKSDIFG